ncbi:hypothetical protein LshimejAT787_0107610 [Lyophyllum shimeji]|uniref:Uncharacterized protein n=1 Tax=Lyophyllum shimeji TaxID=47721 RepID=A0A9P3PDI3_LYOSH|nr:hypothetical protein LshimejAT787_0107610 [Lyophyllum shimeji]
MSRSPDPNLASSPVTGFSSEQPSSPITPSPSMRTRHAGRSPDESSSTTMSGSTPPNASRMNDITRSTFRSIFTSSTNTPRGHIVARADPSLLTCFDPQDKELYDLWAPRR